MTRRWPLTLRGAGAVVLAIGCFVLAHELGTVELVYFGCLLLALVLACVAALHLGRRTERVARSLAPEVVAVGGSSQVRLEVTVRSAVPVTAGRWSDALPDDLEGDAGGSLPAVGSSLGRGEGRVMLSYAVRGIRRGVHAVGPLSLQLSDPFGIARRTQRAGGTTSVMVVPATVELDAIGEFTGDLGGSLHTTSDQLGQGADNLIARPYSPGDSMRRIHWRATAHHDALMVRQEERESTPEATVVFDRSASRWPDRAALAPGADPTFEAGLTAVVSIVRRLARDGYLVEVLDGTGTALVPPIAGGEAGDEIDELLRIAALLTSVRSDQLPSLVPLFAGAAAGPVVLVTGALSEADAALLRPLAHHSSLPILLSARSERDGASALDALDELEGAGWRTGRLDAEGDLSSTWSHVASAGVARAFG